MSQAQDILNCWNIQKYKEEEFGKTKWHIRREVKYDLELAVKTALKNFTVDDIKGAIGNYATVVLGGDYFYDYDKWTIDMFLTRREKDDKNMFKWWKWLPGRFEESDYLRDNIVQQRVSQARRHEGVIDEYEAPTTFQTMPIEQAVAAYEKGSTFLKGIYAKERPEILEHVCNTNSNSAPVDKQNG